MKLTATMIALAVLAVPVSGALAQSQTAATSGRLLRQDNITATGQTVPRPGEMSQGSGPTRPDDSITRDNNRIERSICKGC